MAVEIILRQEAVACPSVDGEHQRAVNQSDGLQCGAFGEPPPEGVELLLHSVVGHHPEDHGIGLLLFFIDKDEGRPAV